AARKASAIRRSTCPAREETDGAGRVAPGRGPARNRSATFSFEGIIVASHVQEQRRGVNQTVDPIEDAAVAGNRRGHIFGADVAFNHADGKIAELPADSNNQSGKNQLPRAEKRKRKSQSPGKNHRNN